MCTFHRVFKSTPVESVWIWEYVFANVGRNNSLWDIHWLSLRNTFSYSAAVNSFPMGSWKTMLQFLDFMQLQRVASNEVTSLGYFKFSLPRKWRKCGSTEKYLNSQLFAAPVVFCSSRYNSAIGGLAKNAEWMQASRFIHQRLCRLCGLHEPNYLLSFFLIKDVSNKEIINSLFSYESCLRCNKNPALQRNKWEMWHLLHHMISLWNHGPIRIYMHIWYVCVYDVYICSSILDVFF